MESNELHYSENYLDYMRTPVDSKSMEHWEDMTRDMWKRVVDNRFKYHAPTSETVVKYTKVREDFRILAESLVELIPFNEETTALHRDFQVLLDKLHEAQMYTNYIIASYTKEEKANGEA